MKLTPLDVQRHEFQQKKFRGLDGTEVRMFLNAVSEEMEQLRSENEKLSEEVRRLTALLGDSTAYDDATHINLGHPVKRLASFRAAAAEAAISRLYGGIHYPADNEQGAVAGRCVAERVLARVRTRAAP